MFKILNYLDCSWTELELFPEEPRNDYWYNTSLRICAISASKKWETEYFPRGIQLIYDSTPETLLSLYLSVLLSLFSFSTLDNCSWKVKRFILINILPLAVDFWSERLTYPFYEQPKRKEASKESTWHDAFSVFQYTHDPSANRANNFTEGSNIEKNSVI